MMSANPFPAGLSMDAAEQILQMQLQMHTDNQARLTVIESEQREQGKTLAAINEKLIGLPQMHSRIRKLETSDTRNKLLQGGFLAVMSAAWEYLMHRVLR
jgi:hypothetical protein